MKRLNESVLLPGDIVLTSSPGKTSLIVRKATRSEISHAMICVQYGSLIDSTDDGVHSRNPQRMFFDEGSTIVVLRPRNALSHADVATITDFARAATGTRYALPEAIKAAKVARKIAKGLRKRTRRQFCSRLAAQAFAAAGIRLVDEPDYCTPQDLRKSALLMEVPGMLVEVSDGEIKAWKKLADIPQLMIDSTNAVLEAARIIHPGIESLNDIDEHLLVHPEDDAAMLVAYQQSGYLAVVDIECQKNPWHYDLRLMREHVGDPGSTAFVEHYCRNAVAGAADGRRFHVNRQIYRDRATDTGLETFICLAQLYGKIADLHEVRMATARSWLKEELGVEASERGPPNSAAWLAILEKSDYAKAAHTRRIIQLAESEAVCAICGDDPAEDHVLEGHPGGLPLRLCDDCVVIRAGMGEVFVPVRG